MVEFGSSTHRLPLVSSRGRYTQAQRCVAAQHEEEAGLRVSCASKKDPPMAEAIYKVGDRLVIRIQGKLAGTIEIKLVKSDAAGKRHIEAEVINLEPGYAGPLEIGATLKFAEAEIVSTYTQPGR